VALRASIRGGGRNERRWMWTGPARRRWKRCGHGQSVEMRQSGEGCMGRGGVRMRLEACNFPCEPLPRGPTAAQPRLSAPIVVRISARQASSLGHKGRTTRATAAIDCALSSTPSSSHHHHHHHTLSTARKHQARALTRPSAGSWQSNLGPARRLGPSCSHSHGPSVARTAAAPPRAQPHSGGRRSHRLRPCKAPADRS
jgi:hypothetical protein